MTFLQTDPLYSIDLSDPEDPVVTGELKVPGFSQYLHPINDDNSVLIAIGQDADENGRVLGLKLSLFDVSKDLDNPEELDVYVFEQDQNTWSGSTASWDERAYPRPQATARVLLEISRSAPYSLLTRRPHRCRERRRQLIRRQL